MIAFTICSNNYIPKAQVLAASIKLKGSLDEVYLVVADSTDETIDYHNLGFDKVIFPHQLEIDNLQWMLENYSIVEFNTALKPFAFQYIFSNTTHNTAYYFDPDIKVYKPLAEFESFWENTDVVLTPHALTPIPLDDKFPGDNLFLNHGSFNLGFIGLRRSDTATNLLDWWSKRLAEYCIIDLKEGYFVDQIWCNLIPIYYREKVTITNHPGWNAAYWNLHERNIVLAEDIFLVNNNNALFFYHFSSFDNNMISLSPGGVKARYSFQSKPELKALYQDYKNSLSSYNLVYFKSLVYFNGAYPLKPPSVPMHKRVSRKIKREIRNILHK